MRESFPVVYLLLASVAGCGGRIERVVGIEDGGVLCPTPAEVCGGKCGAITEPCSGEVDDCGACSPGYACGVTSANRCSSAATLFGGLGANDTLYGTTWTWDSRRWTQVLGPQPEPRFSAGLTWVGSTLVLFGGMTSLWRVSGDTWTWNDASWSLSDPGDIVSSPSEPGPQEDMAMAALGDSIVLFAGAQGRTWVWQNGVWSERMVAGPPARHAVRASALHGRLVVFGGLPLNLTINSLSEALLGDTWEWDGSAWTQRATAGPRPRFNYAMATLGDKVVLFGGVGSPTTHANPEILGDTWQWDGNQWEQLQVTGPAPRNGPAAATVEGKVVLFGGLGANWQPLGDTWEWDGSAWTQRDVSGPPPLSGAAMAAPAAP